MKKLGGLSKLLHTELTNFNRYSSNQISVLGYKTYARTDTLVKDVMSFSEWVFLNKTFPTVKIEGLEDQKYLLRRFKSVKIKNIHLFLNQKTGVSFKWHKDNINVILYVVSGKKIVYVKNKQVVLLPGQHVIIPKGHMHKVFSVAGTLALSVGY